MKNAEEYLIIVNNQVAGCFVGEKDSVKTHCRALKKEKKYENVTFVKMTNSLKGAKAHG